MRRVEESDSRIVPEALGNQRDSKKRASEWLGEGDWQQKLEEAEKSVIKDSYIAPISTLLSLHIFA